MPKKDSKIDLEIIPDDVSFRITSDKLLSSILDKQHIEITFPCGGNGSCGKCAVQFMQGTTQAGYADKLFFTPNELKQGYRLACQCRLSTSAQIRIPDETRQGKMVVLKDAKSRKEKVNPLITMHHLKISPPSLANLKSDEQLLLESLYKKTKKRFHISANCLRRLPSILRESGFELITYIGDHEVLEIVKGSDRKDFYGVAVDIGTTTLVVSMHNLISGQTMGVEASLNPNIKYGDDLISRVTYISDDVKRLRHLQQMLLGKINRLITRIRLKLKIPKNRIYVITVAGNAVMNHLFSGINPKTIALAPYTPVFNSMRKERAVSLKLSTHSAGLVFVLPNLGGFVGGDVVADMLVAGFGLKNKKTRLLIDIGTNCEVVLEKGGICFAASSPAGPALEGACITYGMRAESGAIYDVQINTGGMNIKTIGDGAARGICGSGLFHLVDAFTGMGIIDKDGRIADVAKLKNKQIYNIFKSRIGTVNNSDAILVANKKEGAVRDIYLTQSDIRDFQLAKSAIVSAWNILCKEVRCDPEEIEEIYIAGAFGNYIRPDTALRLGLVPKRDLNHIHFIGNAALEGARMVLLNKKNLEIIKQLARDTKFIELAGREDFQEAYITNLSL
jgi:uncharacterized 2Fe-2S/4Fe-4S cluster protein (DUF4445 family)